MGKKREENQRKKRDGRNQDLKIFLTFFSRDKEGKGKKEKKGGECEGKRNGDMSASNIVHRMLLFERPY